jgi:HEAT repeat protein
MIRFLCPKCGKRLKSPPESAGRPFTCTKCGLAQTVPAAPPVFAVPVAPGTPTPAGPVTDSLPAPRKWRPLVVAAWLGGGLLTVAGIVIIVLLVQPTVVDQKLTDLKSSDARASTQALQWFADNDPQDAQRAKVTVALETLLFDGDIHKNLSPDLVLRVYLIWANQDNVPAMIRMVQNPTLPNWGTPQAALVMEALGKMHDERAAGALADKLPDPALHDQAVNALTVLGPKATPAVMEYAFDNDPKTRQRAEQVLDSYGVKPKTIAAEARARLRSSQTDVQHSGLVWFLENGPSDDASRAESAKLLANLLSGTSTKVVDQALKALKSWATKDALPQLLEYARTQQNSASGSPLLIDVLAQFPTENSAQALVLYLPDAQGRARASQALLKLGPVATAAVLPYINDPDVDVQNAARDLIGRLNVPGDRLLQQILADVAGTSIPSSRAALQFLAGMRPDDASRATVSKALNAPLVDANKGIADDALKAVLVWGSRENTDTLLTMLGAFQKGGPGRNLRIIAALGTLKDPKAAPTLAQGLSDVHERDAASRALKSIGPAAEDSVVSYVSFADPLTRFEAARVLAEIGTAKSLQPLQDALSRWGDMDPIFGQQARMSRQSIEARAPKLD